jgi:hypothetical protein
VPDPNYSVSIPLAFNQLSFFAVQPGENFHDVEEVWSGWQYIMKILLAEAIVWTTTQVYHSENGISAMENSLPSKRKDWH